MTISHVRKGALRCVGVTPPRVHDVSQTLSTHAARLPDPLRGDLDVAIRISKSLRRDREIAFYGTEDLIPGEFYDAQDAREAMQNAKQVVDLVTTSFPTPNAPV